MDFVKRVEQVLDVVKRVGTSRVAGDERPLPRGKRGENFGPQRLQLFQQLVALALRSGVFTYPGEGLDSTLEIQDRLFEVFFFHSGYLGCCGPSGIVEFHA